MPYDVFINHSTDRKLTAYAICSELESIGIKCWILPRDLGIGIAGDQSIANAVKSCRIMIVVLSGYANRSDRVERQLELAFNHGVIVIPFRTEPDSVASEQQPSPDSVHWLDTVTPEMTQQLRSLRDLIGGIILRLKNDSLPDSYLAKSRMPAIETVDAHESVGKRGSLKQPGTTSKWLLTKALLLILLPFAIICAVGLLHEAKGPELAPAKPPAAAPASIAPLAAVKVKHLDKFAASNPGWGSLDANWKVADDKLQVTPLLNSSAVLINHKMGFTDAEISVDIVMSNGEDLGQLAGLIFWAKDYNDCYALVISADGKFAVGRKLIGRWINPIAKTGNPAVKTGIGQTNKLRVRTEGSLVTAFINDVKVASLGGEPPQGIAYIGLYGESGETTQNVWEFTDVTVSSMR